MNLFAWLYAFLLFFQLQENCFVQAQSIIQKTQQLSAYQILKVPEDASQQQIRSQYKKLKKIYRDQKNSPKGKELQKAFKDIMIDNTLEITMPKQKKIKKNRRRRRGLPKLRDIFNTQYFTGNKNGRKQNAQNPGNHRKQKDALLIQDEKNYKKQLQSQYGYRLPSQYDDPSFYKDVNRTQKIFKQDNTNWNIKIARIILFLGGILLKLSPCLILFCIYKYKRNANPNPVGVQDVLTRAANGWTGRSRKTYKSK